MKLIIVLLLLLLLIINYTKKKEIDDLIIIENFYTKKEFTKLNKIMENMELKSDSRVFSRKTVCLFNNNQNVSISFFWSSFERQVIIEGICSKISPIDSDKYFYSRPIESQIGAIVSSQSTVIPNREHIENKFNSFKLKRPEISRPSNWGGYIIEPRNIEFWQGRKNRLHDRIIYQYDETKWSISRLSP